MDYNYGRALEFISSLASEARTTRGTRKLERIRLLLELLGNPQKSYESIHVVGTAGKGSTASICAQILQAHGKRTGLHLSPHLQVVNERMQVNGKMIGKGAFAELAEEIKPFCQQVGKRLGLGKPTYYEATLAMALKHFADSHVDCAVVEAGLGGSLDATNVISPCVTIITNVFLDHTQILGKTIQEITADKAGAIKPKVPVVTGASGAAVGIVEKTCKKNDCRLERLGKEIIAENISCTATGSEFDLKLPDADFQGLHISLIGKHQVGNAALAACAASKVVELREKPLRQALADAFVPCRLEVVQRHPLVVLDGAHNPTKAAALVPAMKLFGRRKRIVVAGIAATKDAAGIIKALEAAADEFVFTKGTGRKFHGPEKLRGLTARKSVVVEGGANAVESALQKASAGDLVCVTGSLYLCGETRRRWLSDEIALKQKTLQLLH